MKNVALMTWYKYRNYGTALQSTALYKTIADLGYAVKMVSYSTKLNAYQQDTTFSYIGAIKKYIKDNYCNSSYTSNIREMLFNKFLETRITETHLCDTYSDLYRLNNDFDAFICGSDQVWSLSNCFDDKYFLSFVDPNRLKISYAPSFGLTDIQIPEMGEIVKGLINRFDYLSVRESAGVKIIKRLTGRDANLVLDPTLLLSSKEWDIYADVKENLISGKYIICYFLGDDKKYYKNVRLISRSTGMPYFIIPTHMKDMDSDNRVPFEVGPSEFVSLIKGAEYVCTDSYHGLALSITYGKPFTIYKRFHDGYKYNQNSRIESLLDLLDLNERLSEEAYLNTIDYGDVQRKLQECRTASLEYIKNALADESKPVNFKPTRFLQTLCTGCGACANACSQGAIEINRNADGFYHYEIDETGCINCGVCSSVCPIKNKPLAEINNAQGLYALKHRSSQVLKKSSSGGASHAIAEMTLKDGFHICGVTYDSNSNLARHIIVDSIDDLYKIQGSKYLQSSSEPVIRELIKQGHPFVFFGTPCQVAGLDLLLRKKHERENAVLIELVCHGVPSGLIWDKYLTEISQKNNFKGTVDCVFRNKEYSWRHKTITLSSGDKQYCAQESKDDFYAFFKYPIAFMPACYECQYRDKSSADIRIGDFWGKEYAKDRTGVSLVVVMSEAGKRIIDKLDNVDIKAYEPRMYFEIQTKTNPQKNIFYKTFLDDVRNDTFTISQLRDKYCTYYEKVQRYNKWVHLVKHIIRK